VNIIAVKEDIEANFAGAYFGLIFCEEGWSSVCRKIKAVYEVFRLSI
jgi:hypothetical protein